MEWRFAGRADVPELARLNKVLVEDEDHRNKYQDLEFFERRLFGFMDRGQKVVMFTIRGVTAAYALFAEEGDSVYLHHFVVDRAFRRQGVGSEAIRALREEVWPGGRRLAVRVQLKNESGHAFWRAMGYEDYAMELQILPPGMKD